MLENARELKAHTGGYFDHWRRAVVASVGGFLLSDVLELERRDEHDAPDL